jgi:hypothetical protein
MKTSNQILLGFLIIVFLIPVVVVMSFKSKISNNEFVVVKDGFYLGDNYRSGSLKPYQTVKLVAPKGKLLKCYLEYSDSMSFSYSNDNGADSIKIYNLGDTLFVQVSGLPSKNNPNQFRDEFYANLRLPAIENIVVDGAEVTILSANPAKINDMKAEIHGGGTLNIGKREEDFRSPGSDGVNRYGQISLRSDNGSVFFGKKVQVANMLIDVNGKSTINIEEGAAIDDLKGNLSDSSSVNASWKYVKRLLPLAGQ